MMIYVLFALLRGWNFFLHSLMSEVYGLLSESQALKQAWLDGLFGAVIISDKEMACDVMVGLDFYPGGVEFFTEAPLLDKAPVLKAAPRRRVNGC